MKIKVYDVFLWIVTITFLSCVFLMPETVPIRWTFDFKVDEYGSRYMYFIFALLPLLTYYGMQVTKAVDPRKKKIQLREKTYDVFRIILSSFFILIGGFFTYLVFYPTGNLRFMVFFIFGLLFVLTGNYMPKLPQSYFLGIRTPWTLANEYVWRRSHQVSGYVYMVAGVLLIAIGLFDFKHAYIDFMIVILGCVIIPFIHSYLVYRKVESKNTD